jgi:ascorbate-specific PTS system EIIC-type component UlaA
VTVSEPIIPERVPAVTTAVVLPLYALEVVRVGFDIVSCISGVAGKTAVIIPESTALVEVAPATVK